MFKTGPLYLANYQAPEPVVVNQGGQYSSKTYSIMQVLFSKAISMPNATITVVGQDIPNLKRGSLRDSQKIYANSPELQACCSGYNATDRIYKFNSGSIIEFVSYENEQDARNGKRDILFINEANGIPWEIADVLISKTSLQTFIDYNPSAEFWAHTQLIYPGVFGAKKVKLIISDHRHNPFLTQEQHDHIEQRAKDDPEWGKVYARGLTGKIEGLIFRNWNVVEGIPAGATLVGRGLDFGFTNDPTALVNVYKQNGELWVDCPLYETNLTNQKIAERLRELNSTDNIIADSAEPKSIEELRVLGMRIEGAQKGKDSILNSIDIIKRYPINVTRDSVEFRKEIAKYVWKKDKITNKSINEPSDFDNHAIDALRYVALNRLPNNNYGKYVVA